MRRRPTPVSRACRCRRWRAPRGAAGARCAIWAGGRAPAKAASSAQDLGEFTDLRAARQLQEQLFEAGIAGFVLAAHVADGSRGDDLAVLDDRDLVAHRFGDFEGVRAHQYGAAATNELPENVLEQSRRFGVQPNHRLVDDDAFGAVNEGARDDQLLPHAMAVSLDQLVLPARQLEHLEELGDAALDDVAFLSIQSRHETQELGAGEFVVHERSIRNKSEPHLGGERVDVHVVAAEEHAALRRPQNAGDHPQRGRLARAVGAEASVQHTAGDVEADVVDGDEAAVELGQILQTDHRTSSLSRPISGTSSTCRASPPTASRTCAASAGNWSNSGSMATQSPR